MIRREKFMSSGGGCQEVLRGKTQELIAWGGGANCSNFPVLGLVEKKFSNPPVFMSTKELNMRTMTKLTKLDTIITKIGPNAI
jgi:hypothetical protein